MIVTDEAELGQALDEIDQCLAREQPGRSGQRGNPRQLRSDWLNRKYQTVLNNIAANRRDAKQHQRNAKGRNHIHRQRLHELRERGTVGRYLVGFGEQRAERGLKARGHRHRKHHDHKRTAGDHEPGVYFRAFGDVAAPDRLLESPWARIFGAFAGVAFFFSHCRRLTVRTEGVHHAPDIVEKKSHHRAEHHHEENQTEHDR